MITRERGLVALLTSVLLAITCTIAAGRNGLPYGTVSAQGSLPPKDTLRSVTNEYIQQFNLPIGEVIITLHADVTTANAAALAAEVAQMSRVLYFARPPTDNSPSFFVTFSVPENAAWLNLEPALPELEQQLREKVLLPGRQVYLLKWESAVTTADGQPLPPELSFLAASFESLAVFDGTMGVVHDSIMAMPVTDMTSLPSFFPQTYLPLIVNQAQPTTTRDAPVPVAAHSARSSAPGYDDDDTHTRMAEQAASLAGKDELYAEIGDPAIVEQIEAAVIAEDGNVSTGTTILLDLSYPYQVEIGDSRFFHHFYDPDSSQGLAWEEWYHGLALLSIKESIKKGIPLRFYRPPEGGRFSSALEWGRDQHADGLDWKHAIEMYDYDASSKQLAYRWLGHVVHLIQDMAQPDHTRLLPHPGSGLGIPALTLDKGPVELVGYEALWAQNAGQWPVPDQPGCPYNIVGQTLDDFYNSMAISSKEQSDWWEKVYRAPVGDEEALGLTYLRHWQLILFQAATRKWVPQIHILASERVPLVPTIPLTDPGDYLTMGRRLINEAVACTAALMQFYYDIVNHPPYVSEVIVKQPDAGFPDDIVYHAKWEDQRVPEQITDLSSGESITVEKLKERQLDVLRDESLQDNTPAIVEVRFGPSAGEHGGAGKELDEDSIQVRVGDIEVTKVAFGRDEPDGPVVWRGVFTPDIFTGDRLAITISARDSHNHFDNRAHNGSLLDSNPQTPARATSTGPAYEWSGYEPGEDRNHYVFHTFKISHHNTVAFVNEDADAILAEASSALQHIDGPGDVACPVRLVRDEDVFVFTDSTGIINTRTDQELVMALPGNAKVVSQLNYCHPTFGINLVGCAESPGDSFIVENIGSYPAGGVLWAHAFGNNQGLPNCEQNCGNRLMNHFILAANRIIDANECAAFLRPRSMAQVAGFLPATQEVVNSSQKIDVKDFVRRLYLHGVPYHQAIQYGAEDVDILIKMLQDPVEEPYWSNIVITLGMIGDEKAIVPLLEFINKDVQGELSPSHYKAITGAIGSLGYLLNKSGNQAVLTYLQASLDPNVWTQRIPPWTSPFHDTLEARNTQLSIMAIIGLGLSGYPQAEQSLRALQEPATTLSGQEFQERTGAVVDEALKALEFIASEGLSQYYRQAGH